MSSVEIVWCDHEASISCANDELALSMAMEMHGRQTFGASHSKVMHRFARGNLQRSAIGVCSLPRLRECVDRLCTFAAGRSLCIPLLGTLQVDAARKQALLDSACRTLPYMHDGREILKLPREH
jgi:hypothetical protein